MNRSEAAPWGAIDVTKGVALFVAGGVGLVALGLWFIAERPVGDLFVVLATSVALQAVALGAALRFSIHKHGATFEQLGFCKSEGLKGWLVPFIGLAASLLLTAAYVGLVDYFDMQALRPPELPVAIQEASGIGKAAAALVVIVIGPVAEETFFRGFVYQGLRGSLGVAGAAVISAGLFAGAHADIGLLVPAFLSGLVLTWVFVRTGCLGPAILAHSLQNFLAFITV